MVKRRRLSFSDFKFADVLNDRTIGYYKLDADRIPQRCSLLEWGMDREQRGDAAVRVALENVGPVQVSTVFLGFDHGWDGPPMLFETMLFGGPEAFRDYQERCSTWQEAEAMHARAVNFVRERLKA